MESIDHVLAGADRAWRAYGVASADRAVLGADLRVDLQAAASDGVDPAQLIGDDVAEFARRLADEAGIRPAPRRYGQVLGATLIGAIVAGVLAAGLLMVVYPLLVWLVDMPRSVRIPVPLAVAVYYGVPAAVVVTGAVTAIRLRLRDLPEVRRTAWAVGILLALAGIVVTPVTMAFAWLTGYSTSPQVVLTEAAAVVAALAGATVLGRRLSLWTRPQLSGGPATDRSGGSVADLTGRSDP